METDFHVGADGKARLEEQAQGPNHARRTGRGLLSCSESRRGGEDRWEDRWEATDPNVLGLMLPYIAWDGAPQAQFRPKLARRRVRAPGKLNFPFRRSLGRREFSSTCATRHLTR
jgi:hypothetical protein